MRHRDLRGDMKSGERITAAASPLTDQSFRLLVESVKDYAIFMLDVDGHVVSWNAGAQHIKGYHAEEILRRHFSVFYTPDDLGAGRPDWVLREAAIRGHFEDEGWRLRKDGTRFWASVVITALHDEHRTLLGFAKITRDLTERRRAEQVLRESEERFGRLLLASPIAAGILTGDLERVVDANPRFAELLGYKRAGALVGNSARDVGLWTDPGEVERLVGGLRTQRSIREARVHYRTRDGQAHRALAVLELLKIDGEDHVLALFWRA